MVVNLIYFFAQRLFKSINQTDFEKINLFQMSPAIIYMVFNVLLSILLIEIDRKLGVGNFWKLLTGRFYNPKEEERIFMFIDLKGSTSTAEKLGHIKFNAFLQDCFYDLAIVSKHLVAVYQYVGDEVVLSWNYKNGFKNENFIKAFFAFDKILSDKSDYYLEKYGILPYFKTGINFGPIVVAEVGSSKREICCHGDTLNTASRIQGLCNKLNSKMLIPEKLYEKVKNSQGFNFEDVGCVELQGKKKELRLFKVVQA